MAEYGKSMKKFVFYETDHTHAKLRVKFLEDGIKQATFFKEIVKAYIEDDPNIRRWIDNNPQTKVSGRSLTKKKHETKAIEKEKENFNHDKQFIEEIFDILSEEFGD